ncbi:MAG TPA: DUF1343 domain-containing protein [Bacteroidales bacterium]|nr:DUF1343 domain-containing protein [Bacteroidales bacterium]
MMIHQYILIVLSILWMAFSGIQTGNAQPSQSTAIRQVPYTAIRTGAERSDVYVPLLKGKRVGIVCNQNSRIGTTHLVDYLLESGVKIEKIFAPEHGIRGDVEAGGTIDHGTDERTGIRIVSLYGSNKKPAQQDLAGLDLIIFDIQDVGVRFYTYISTLALVMEAAAENDLPVVVTDRPNPNGFYTDGPVLDTNFKSFVGMHPVPVVYGMTIGEYALMVNGEGWLGSRKCELTVIPMEGYDHNMLVTLPFRPSPNLTTWESIYLYPSTCFFEGTIVSVGRGTLGPFQVFGHPGFLIGSYKFTPVKIPGMAEKPLFEGEECLGHEVTEYAHDFLNHPNQLNLFWLIESYRYFSGRADFFNSYFDKLAGTDRLRLDILGGTGEDEIRKSWEPGLSDFRAIREKYLIYP